MQKLTAGKVTVHNLSLILCALRKYTTVSAVAAIRLQMQLSIFEAYAGDVNFHLGSLAPHPRPSRRVHDGVP